MGAKQQRKNIAIIDEMQKVADFREIWQDDRLNCLFYSNFDEFIERQSFKDLRHVIIRSSEQKKKNKK